MKRVINDIGSFIDILYFDVFQILEFLTNDLTPMTSLLMGSLVMRNILAINHHLTYKCHLKVIVE